jgi:hypothetical protein
MVRWFRASASRDGAPRATTLGMYESHTCWVALTQYLRLTLALLLALPSIACSSESTTTSDGPTYFAQVKAIVDAKCVSCHDGSGVAPYDFRSHAGLHAARGLVGDAVSAGTMPPWPLAAGCNEYVADRSLDDTQIDIIVRWAEADGPEGDVGEEGPAIDAGPVAALSRVDRALEIPEPYTPTFDSGDDYRCFLIDWPETATTYLTGFRAVPDATAIVHHMIAFVAGPDDIAAVSKLDADEPGPGYHCYGGPGVAAAWLGIWTPGTAGTDFPAGTGIPIEPGSKLVLQVHYSQLSGDADFDQSHVELKLEPQVDRIAWIQSWTDPTWFGDDAMLIPAGARDVKFAASFDPTLFVSGGEPFVMHAAGLHMHALGRSTALRIDRADGSSECLLDIPKWDFGWQGSYGFIEPKTLEPGDQIYMECRFDNGVDDQLRVDGALLPPRDVDWGEGVRDEMCLAGFYLSTP